MPIQKAIEIFVKWFGDRKESSARKIRNSGSGTHFRDQLL